MGSATIVSRVFAKLQELLNVHVPCFEIGTDRAFTLTALVHGNGGIVDHLEERDNALTLSVGALDIGAERTNRCPVISKPACKLRQHGVVLNRTVDTVQVVWDSCQVARAQLGSQCARVEQGGCRAHVVKR